MENDSDGYSLEVEVKALEWRVPRVASFSLLLPVLSPIPSF